MENTTLAPHIGLVARDECDIQIRMLARSLNASGCTAP